MRAGTEEGKKERMKKERNNWIKEIILFQAPL
jgi:hypothetical protein